MDKPTKRLLISTLILGLVALISGVAGVAIWKDTLKDISVEMGEVLSETAENIPQINEENNGEGYLVTDVIDGDTIDVNIDGKEQRIRMIGIDTPELRGSECFSQEAKLQLISLVEGKNVQLMADPTQDNIDRYDRLLRYVFVDGKDINLEMIKTGFAHEYTYRKAYLNQTSYKQAQASAQANSFGMWGQCN